jgi:hypothetical protein
MPNDGKLTLSPGNSSSNIWKRLGRWTVSTNRLHSASIPDSDCGAQLDWLKHTHFQRLYSLVQHVATTCNSAIANCQFPANASLQTIFSGRQSLMDEYEYVMYGKVYKYKDTPDKDNNQVKVEVYVSYGGLLMKLSGDPRKLEELELDSNVYLLIRKV